jgi:hypothetical protein
VFALGLEGFIGFLAMITAMIAALSGSLSARVRMK